MAKRHTVRQNGDIFTVNSPVSSFYRISVDIGDVHVPNVVIDSGAVTNVVTKNTWGQRQSNVKANTCCSAINLFVYGGDKPLPTLGTFTARVVCSETNRSCIAILSLLMALVRIFWGNVRPKNWEYCTLAQGL